MSEELTIDKEQVKNDYLSGMRNKDIVEKYKISINTLKSWIKRYRWVDEKKKGAPQKKKRGAPFNNTNSVGNSGGAAPDRNRNAEKYGFFSKYLPEETKEIFDATSQADPLDLLWHQIQIAYAAIIRAQRIAYVKDQQDKTIEKIEEKDGNVIGEKWEVQQAWDKQNNFLKAQARAQATLQSMIKQYDEMLHKNWEMTSEEQRSRIDQIKANTERLKANGTAESFNTVVIVNDLPEDDYPD